MNRLKIQILLAGVLLCLGSCAPSDRKDGSKDFKKILASAPFTGITDSIGRFPNEPSLYLERATMLSQNNYHGLATDDYKKAWELSGNPDVALGYISNLLLADDMPQAMELLKNCIIKFPENTEFHRRLGELYRQQKQPEKALEQYNTLLDKDSTNFEAWFDKGTLLAAMKDTAAAITSLETSFALLPVNYTGIALANIYVYRKDPRLLEVCDILLSKDTSNTLTEPLFLKAVYYSDIQQKDQALKLFDECIRRDWKMTDAYIEKGIIYYERKNYPEALKIFTTAATVSNTDADAYYWMGRCFEATGDKEQAITNYERAYALENSFSEARERIKHLAQ